MNRTQRAMLRSCKEAAASSRRQKNGDISRRNKLIKSGRNTEGWDRSINIRDVIHMSECVKKDARDVKSYYDDIKIYKKRFADAKKHKEEIVA